MKSLTSLVLSVAALAVTPLAMAGEKPQPLPDQQDAVSRSLMPCPGGLERFLPGDYYFCSAARSYWSGHDGLARESLLNAASWASKPAQYALGVMYFNGDHAEKNRPLGLAWLALAAERHDPAYEPAFVSAYKQVTPEELAQANAYWKDMKTKYADAVAAPRAERRFDREYQQIAWAVNFGGSIFIDGVTLPYGYAGIPGGAPLQSGFSLGRMLQTQKAMYFYGYDSHVFVGDAELVPISQVTTASRSE
jgi:TPR repeat protein